MRRVDLYHFSLPLSLTHISLSYFSCLQSLNTLVNVILEVKTEMVCAMQMVSSDRGDSTFSPSCVKVQMGCSLCCSMGHSEDVWTMCSVVAWEGASIFSREGRVFDSLQLGGCSEQAARKDADVVVPHFVQENELGDLSKACSGMRWFSTPTLTLPPHSCIYSCQMRDWVHWDGQWFTALPTSFSF